MELIFATMIVLGCSENLLVCNKLIKEDLYYQSVAACENHVQQVIDPAPTYPVILAKCLPVEGGARGEDIKVTWYVDQVRHLQAYVEQKNTASATIDVASMDSGSDS